MFCDGCTTWHELVHHTPLIKWLLMIAANGAIIYYFSRKNFKKIIEEQKLASEAKKANRELVDEEAEEVRKN